MYMYVSFIVAIHSCTCKILCSNSPWFYHANLPFRFVKTLSHHIVITFLFTTRGASFVDVVALIKAVKYRKIKQGKNNKSKAIN